MAAAAPPLAALDTAVYGSIGVAVPMLLAPLGLGALATLGASLPLFWAATVWYNHGPSALAHGLLGLDPPGTPAAAAREPAREP